MDAELLSVSARVQHSKGFEGSLPGPKMSHNEGTTCVRLKRRSVRTRGSDSSLFLSGLNRSKAKAVLSEAVAVRLWQRSTVSQFLTSLAQTSLNRESWDNYWLQAAFQDG